MVHCHGRQGYSPAVGLRTEMSRVQAKRRPDARSPLLRDKLNKRSDRLKSVLEELKDFICVNNPMFMIRRLTVVKMMILPKLIYRFNMMPIKTAQIPAAFLAEIDKLILKCVWKVKGPRIVKMVI